MTSFLKPFGLRATSWAKSRCKAEAKSRTAEVIEDWLRQTSAGPEFEFWNKLEQVLDFEGL
jgi:hypothetical protein